MLNPIANAIVIAVFGLLLGGLTGVLTLLTKAQGVFTEFEKGVENLNWTARDIWKRATSRPTEVRALPRSIMLLEVVLVAFGAMLIVVLWITPVTMRWPIFLIAAFVAYVPSFIVVFFREFKERPARKT